MNQYKKASSVSSYTTNLTLKVGRKKTRCAVNLIQIKYFTIFFLNCLSVPAARITI